MKTINMKDMQIISKSELPKQRSKTDYTPLLKSIATLGPNEVLLLPMGKPHEITPIKKAVNEAFKTKTPNVGQVTLRGELICAIQHK